MFPATRRSGPTSSPPHESRSVPSGTTGSDGEAGRLPVLGGTALEVELGHSGSSHSARRPGPALMFVWGGLMSVRGPVAVLGGGVAGLTAAHGVGRARRRGRRAREPEHPRRERLRLRLLGGRADLRPSTGSGSSPASTAHLPDTMSRIPPRRGGPARSIAATRLMIAQAEGRVEPIPPPTVRRRLTSSPSSAAFCSTGRHRSALPVEQTVLFERCLPSCSSGDGAAGAERGAREWAVVRGADAF